MNTVPHTLDLGAGEDASGTEGHGIASRERAPVAEPQTAAAPLLRQRAPSPEGTDPPGASLPHHHQPPPTPSSVASSSGSADTGSVPAQRAEQEGLPRGAKAASDAESGPESFAVEASAPSHRDWLQSLTSQHKPQLVVRGGGSPERDSMERGASLGGRAALQAVLDFQQEETQKERLSAAGLSPPGTPAS